MKIPHFSVHETGLAEDVLTLLKSGDTPAHHYGCTVWERLMDDQKTHAERIANLIKGLEHHSKGRDMSSVSTGVEELLQRVVREAEENLATLELTPQEVTEIESIVNTIKRATERRG